jgi:hypothetical protein
VIRPPQLGHPNPRWAAMHASHIPLLLLCLLASSPTFADRFAGRSLRVDTRVGAELSAIDDAVKQLPILKADETFQIELFVAGGRGGRTRSISVAFDNTGNTFGAYFAIVGIRGILPKVEFLGPTAIRNFSEYPITIPQNDYFATVTLRVIKETPSGLTLGFHTSRTTIEDESNRLTDILSVGGAQISFGRPTYSLFLDLDTKPGNQNVVKSLGLTGAADISIQVFGDRIRFMTGFILRFKYDKKQLVFDTFLPAATLPNPQSLPPSITQLDATLSEVEVAGASFSGSANVEAGLLGTLFFKANETLTRTGVVMTGAEIRRGGTFNAFNTQLSIELSRLDSDFDKDGTVGFRDFLLFAEHFGSQRGQDRYDATFDLLPDSNINFADFVLFTESLTIFTITVIN